MESNFRSRSIARRAVGVLGMALLSAVLAGRTAEEKPAATGASQLTNAGFEDGFKGWMLRDASQPDATYQIVSGTKAFQDGKSALINITATTPERLKTAAYVARRDLPTAAGYYHFRFALRTDLTAGTAGARIIAINDDKPAQALVEPGKGLAPAVRGRSDWATYETVYRLKEPAKTVVLQLETSRATGTVAFDDVRVERLSDAEGAALMQKLNPQPPDAATVGAAKLGEPCRIVNARIGIFYRDPQSGENRLAINSTTPGAGSHGAAILIDYLKHHSAVLPLPEGSGGWDIIETSPGRLLFESLAPLNLITVDTAKPAVDKSSVTPVPATQYAWRFTRGSDGWIYFGSYPTCHAYRYNPQNNAVEDLGFMGPEGNLYLRHIGITADGWLLCSVGVEKKAVVAYEVATKKQQIVVDGQSPFLVPVAGEVYATISGELQRFDSAAKSFVKPNLPAPPTGEKWTWILPTSTTANKVLRAGDGQYYQIKNGGAPRLVWNLDLRGGSLVGVDDADNVIGYRGQDYFVAAPLAQTIEPQPIAENPPPVAMHFLRADPLGGVTGGPSFGQTLFRFDPARHLAQNTPQVVNGGGEVYDGQWVDGKFYFVAYGGGDLAVWDPAQPWDQWNNKNPRLVGNYKSKEAGSFIRPIGGLVVGPKGRLYGGWSAAYGMAAGGLSEYDIATGNSRTWTNERFAAEMSIGSIAADARYVYGVTSNHFSGIKRPLRPVVFWVFDPATEKVVFKKTLNAATTGPVVVRIPQTGRIWLADSEGMHAFDAQKLQFTQTVAWPRGIGAPAAINAHDARGSSAWFAAGATVVRLDDRQKPAATAVFAANIPIQSLAAGADGKLYFTQGTELWAAPLRAGD